MADVLKDMYLDEKLVLMHMSAKSDQDALDQMANMLLKEGIVKESYIPAVKAREIEYSTGLQCENMGVAIPHTDAEHVNVQAIGIGLLDEPVRFQQMGMPEINVETSIIFMLAIKEAHKQMDFLQALMMIFQEKEELSKILASETPREVVNKFTTYFQEISK